MFGWYENLNIVLEADFRFLKFANGEKWLKMDGIYSRIIY